MKKLISASIFFRICVLMAVLVTSISSWAETRIYVFVTQGIQYNGIEYKGTKSSDNRQFNCTVGDVSINASPVPAGDYVYSDEDGLYNILSGGIGFTIKSNSKYISHVKASVRRGNEYIDQDITTGKTCYVESYNFTRYEHCCRIDVTFVDKQVAISGGQSSYTAYVGQDFHEPTFKTSSGYTGSPSYSSSNPSVATVDPSTGAVTPLKAGTTNITVRYPSNDDWAGNQFTYQLNVKAFSAGNGTAQNPYIIKSVDEWNLFCEIVNSGYVNICGKLGQDVGPVTQQCTRSNQSYYGTFDGDNHKLTVNLNGAQYMAPFAALDGATVKNLKVEGSITASGKYAAGIAGLVQGHKATITNCNVGVNINSTVNGDGTHGGILAVSNAETDIKDCAFYGSISGSNTNSCAGFVGWANKKATITNCLLTASIKVNATNGATFYRGNNAQIVNSYYYKDVAHGTAQGNACSYAQIRYGEIAWRLNNGRSPMVWGQGSPDATLTNDENLHVFRVVYKVNGKDKLYQYYYGNKTLTYPSAANLGLTGNIYFSLISGSKITSDADCQVSLPDKNGAIQVNVSNINDWNLLSSNISNGATNIYARLTDNISDVTTMIGTKDHSFTGTFDGQGHTLTVKLSGDTYAAPFCNVDKAVIKNLNVAGTVTCTINNIGGHASGLVGCVNTGGLTIDGCEVSASISSTHAAKDTHCGGFIGHAGSNVVTITNSIFTGKATGGTFFGSFVGWGDAYTANISNCLTLGSYENIRSVNTFVRANGKAKFNVNNCYYFIGNQSVASVANADGTAVSNTQVSSGEVAYKLAWGQRIGSENRPYYSSRTANKVFKVTFVLDGKEYTARYANKSGTVDLPAVDHPSDYSVAFTTGDNEEFNSSTQVGNDMTVTVTKYLTGAGTQDNPYLIRTAKDLKSWSDKINGGFKTYGVYFLQTNDIDMSSISWFNPIGQTPLYYNARTIDNVKEHGFEGTYDGGGHKISNLTIAQISEEKTVGVFGTVTGTVKNVWVDHFRYDGNNSKDTRCGALVGQLLGDGLVTDCIVTNSLVDDDKMHVGGAIAGAISGATLQNCIAYNNTVNFDPNRQGYIAGDTKNDAGWGGTVKNCYTDGNLVCSSESSKQGTMIDNEAGVSSKRFASGEIAWKLGSLSWGQSISADAIPYPSSDAAKHVYKVTFTADGNVLAEEYANKNSKVTTPDIAEIGDGSKVFSQFEYNGEPFNGIVGDISSDITIASHGIERPVGISQENSYVTLDGKTITNGEVKEIKFQIASATLNFTDGTTAKAASGKFNLSYHATLSGSSNDEIVNTDQLKIYGNRTVDIVLNRPIKAGQWTAVCLPFNMSEEQINNAFGNNCKIALFYAVNGNDLEFRTLKANEKKIEAGTPFIIWTDTQVNNCKLADIYLYNYRSGGSATSADWTFVGNVAEVYKHDSGKRVEYFANGNKLKDLDAGGTIPPLRAFLRCDGNNTVNAKLMTFSIDGTTTGIVSVDSTGKVGIVNKGVYNLNGQYLGDTTTGLPQGIYIVNGKKTVVK